MSEFSDQTMKKARELRARDDLHRDEDYPGLVWWALGSNGKTRYRVQAQREDDPQWWTCTCPHGLNSGLEPRCYHVAAAQLDREDDATLEE